MTTKVSTPRPLEILAGVRPLTEGTALTTRQWIAATGIRFVNGFPQKIGGYQSRSFDYSNTLSGKCRSIFSCDFAGTIINLFGTHTRLYSLVGTTLTNITPQTTTTTAVSNSLATLYGTLANNPITTVNGSATVTIADTSAGRLRAGDTVTLAGATTINGVNNTSLNAAQVVRSVAADGLSFTIITGDTANASGAGGGNAVVRKTGIIQVTSAANGLPEGDRVGITGAADTAGILAARINLQFIIRNVAANTFDVMTTGTATSSTTAAGGAGTVYKQQIPAGLADSSPSAGYGMGKYGVGLYGTSKTSSASPQDARIWYWCQQQFSNVMIGTAGGQTGLYEWNAQTTVAPVLVTNAPTAINYAFITDNIVVTFGNVNENRIKTSDQGDRTNWTSSSTNQVFVEDLQGAGKLMSHVNVNGVNLIFTPTQTYTMRWVGGLAVFQINPLDLEVGIIAPMARCEVNGVGYWMGQDNIYMWRGSTVMIVPANTQPSCTLMKYIFNNLNRAQQSKIFFVHKEDFNEIEIHYPSATSTEPDKVARLSLYDYSWTPDVADKTAAEYPVVNSLYQMFTNSSSTVFYDEKGTDADGAALSWSLTSPDQVNGKNNATIVSFVPDSVQTGNITVNVTGRRFPQSTKNTFNKNYTVAPDTERVPTSSSARIWRYTLSGSAIGQSWIMGAWVEEIQEGAAN